MIVMSTLFELKNGSYRGASVARVSPESRVQAVATPASHARQHLNLA